MEIAIDLGKWKSYVVMEENGIEYTLAKLGEDKPNIMTKDFDIEVETGLKHDIKKLENNIIGITKMIYIIVPNDTEKLKYNSMAITKSIKVLTLKAFSI